MPIIFYTNCPVCNASDIKWHTEVRDFSVSGEEFELWRCNQCTALFTQNVPDENSIGEYYQSENYISHTDNRKGFVNGLYHAVRKVTMAGKRRLIEKTTNMKTGSLLDVGAGTGTFAAHMKQHGWQVTGIEPSVAARELAKQTHSICLLASPDLLKLPEESFDIITLWHVLEHVHALHIYMAVLKKLLKPGGAIFIAVPNYTSHDAQKYKQYWAAYDVPRHLYHFSPAAMNILLQLHGLPAVAVKPMWYDSFYVSLLSEKYKTARSRFPAAFWTGLCSDWIALQDTRRCSSIIYIAAK